MHHTLIAILSAACLLMVPVARAGAQQSGRIAQPYTMAGPYEVVARDGAFRSTKGGSERDMRAAWQLAMDGRHAEALAIINAYAATLQRLDGHDAPLCLIQCYWLCRAMFIEKAHRTQAWHDMVQRAMVPTMRQFESDSPYANGNWGAIVNRCRMAAALAMGDTAMYHEAVGYYLHAYDNGALPNYVVSTTGQCQETGRDQNHVQLGLQALAETCEMAWEQGDDLWGALDNRLLHGFEYTARYNLGYDVPYTQWHDLTGLYCDWERPGAMGRGRLWDIYELPYQHYVGRRGLQMPYTERALRLFPADRERTIGREAVVQAPGVKEGAKLHEVFAYAAPDGTPLRHDYDVYVQPRGQQHWTRIDTYAARVNSPVLDGGPGSGARKHRISDISYAFFDFTGDVFVRVVLRGDTIRSARIRPDYRGTIANIVNDSTVQFLLFQPENVSVEVNGRTDMLLFTSKPPQNLDDARRQARREKRRFAYYAPGFYDADTIRLASNTTVYLAGGSYFTGTFAIDDAENVSIVGRGVARPLRGYEGCHVYRSRNVLVDGLIVNTCPVGGSDGVTIRDVRSISHPSWGDGLNVFASQNVFYDRVFCRNSDDCTTAYATRKGFSGNTRNIRMRNSTLWADVAHPIFIGLHGNPAVRDTIEHLVYENIDILGQAEPQVDYQGCLAINCGDDNLVRDVLFDNIRIEQIADGCLLQVKVAHNQKYCTAPGRGVEGVTFRNVRYTGTLPNLSVINGYDATRTVSGITFEGLKVNGQPVYDAMPGKLRWYATSDYVPLFVGNHVSGLQFKVSPHD